MLEAKAYSAVRLVKTLGQDFSNDSIIRKHDLMCNFQANKKLA